MQWNNYKHGGEEGDYASIGILHGCARTGIQRTKYCMLLPHSRTRYHSTAQSILVPYSYMIAHAGTYLNHGIMKAEKPTTHWTV